MKSRYRKNRTGQVSVEFLILISLLMIIFLGVIVLSESYKKTSTSLSTNLYAKSLAQKLSHEINNVFIAGDGSSRSLFLPSTLRDNAPYNISIYPESRIVDIVYTVAGDKKHFSTPILTSAVSGNLTNRQNTVEINNSKGRIDIN
jgi:hypothetical protein